MKILHLLIILNVIICSGVLCTAQATFVESEHETIENCHNMDQHEKSAAEALNIKDDFDNKSNVASTCCNEYLTNSQSDQYVKVIYQEAPKSLSQSRICQYDKNINYIVHKEHDPPDIQILNSIFII